MASTAWKDVERRRCRALGAERRGPDPGSDDDGSAPFALECKRTTHYQLRRAWVEQAKRQGKATGRPWVLSLNEHHDREGLAVLSWPVFVQLLLAAKLITPAQAVDAQ